ncbi:MAG: hypothetical protein ABEH56_06035 [Salinirussus sp.]
MTDDRSERLRKRRKRSRPRSGSGSESGSGLQPRSEREGDSQAGPDAGSDDDVSGSDSGSGSGSVKDEQTGTYMYLPTSQVKELRRVYNVLKAEYEFEFDEEFEKNRHFYPLVVAYGLEQLAELDAPEIRSRLYELDR